MKVFISGGTSGIGKELADLYLAHGHEVAVCGRSKAKYDENFTAENKPKFFELDVSDREAVKKTVREFVGEGELDLMIANAGISMSLKSKTPNFDTFKDVIDINLMGTVYCFEAALEYMEKQKRGHLVSVASVAGYVGLPGAAAYSASKGALIKMCESFSVDLEHIGIYTTCICPGFIDTPLTKINKHPMPFIMSAKRGGRMIFDAIQAKKRLFAFPLPMKIIITILEIIPRPLYHFIMKLPMINYSR